MVILQGSECRRVNDKYTAFIDKFHKSGLGVLRVEKPGLAPDTPLGECVMGDMRKNSRWDGRVARRLGGRRARRPDSSTDSGDPRSGADFRRRGDTFAE